MVTESQIYGEIKKETKTRITENPVSTEIVTTAEKVPLGGWLLAEEEIERRWCRQPLCGVHIMWISLGKLQQRRPQIMAGRQRCIIAHHIHKEIYDQYWRMQDWGDSWKWTEDEVCAKRHSRYETAGRGNGQVDWSTIRTSTSQEHFEHLEVRIERIHNGSYQRQKYHH